MRSLLFSMIHNFQKESRYQEGKWSSNWFAIDNIYFLPLDKATFLSFFYYYERDNIYLPITQHD